MSKNEKHHPRHPYIRRLWKPVVAVGTGGTATLIWWEELLLFGAEILALIAIPILAGAVYIYNILAFKARREIHSQVTKSERK